MNKRGQVIDPQGTPEVTWNLEEGEPYTTKGAVDLLK